MLGDRISIKTCANIFYAPHVLRSKPTWSKLSHCIDAVIHAGAYVHSLYPYQRLCAANVHGTIELLRLCADAAKVSDGVVPAFHHISTLSVFPSLPRLYYEDSELKDEECVL